MNPSFNSVTQNTVYEHEGSVGDGIVSGAWLISSLTLVLPAVTGTHLLYR